MAWVERTGGPGLVFLSLPANPGPTLLNADPGHDARHPALGGRPVAWSEETGSGGRPVRLADWLGPVAGPLGPDPVGVADFPSLQGLGPTVPPSIVNTAPAVAFVDTPPGGVPVVRVAGWDGQAWIPIGGALNVDPARAAGEPLLLYDGSGHWVVFVEADQVIARPWDAALQVWGSPWVLNADPARLARTPLHKDTVVAFLEAGPAGDEIHVRRWTGLGVAAGGGQRGRPGCRDLLRSAKLVTDRRRLDRRRGPGEDPLLQRVRGAFGSWPHSDEGEVPRSQPRPPCTGEPGHLAAGGGAAAGGCSAFPHAFSSRRRRSR